MKHIRSGCGYVIGDNTYTCQGIGPLKDAFKNADPAFEKIPQHIEGFVMTLAPILNMDAANMEVPELACRVDLNPFSVGEEAILNTGTEYTSYSENETDGFLDMYGRVYSNRSDLYFKIDGATVAIGSEDYSFSDTALMGPGILEPMVDTSFGPLGVDTITAVDAGLDGLGYSLDVFGQWRNLIESRINSLSRGVTVDYKPVNGLINLEQAKNTSGSCSNFRISLTGGTPAIIGVRLGDTPSYSIGNGTVYINGATVDVLGITGVAAPFEAYLEVTEDGENPGVYGATVRASISSGPLPGHVKYVHIGNVVSVTGSSTFPHPDANAYTLYQIKQGACIYEIDVGNEASYAEYRGPFWVTCTGGRDLKVTGFDGTEQAPKAGLVYIDGATSYPADTKSLYAVGSSGFVFAHVDLEDTTNGWVCRGCNYTLNEIPDAPATGHKWYTFRLAAYTVEDDIVDIEQIHYGDLYIDIDGGTSSPGEIIYSGPFHLSSTEQGWEVRGVSADAEGSGSSASYYAGKVYFNGAFIGKAPVGVASTAVETTPFVYAHVMISATTASSGEITYDLTGCTYSYQETPGDDATDNVYVIRLAEVDTGTVAKQFHYGDIYLYGATSAIVPPPPPPSSYSGPFMISVSNGTAFMACPDCVADEEDIAGWYSINGGAYTPVNGSSVGGATNNAMVYLQFDASGSPSLSTSESTAPNVYNVLLARILGGTASQLHYGNIQVDGRWN